jgi:signal transduction histidine kinase
MVREHIGMIPIVLLLWGISTFVFINRPREGRARVLFAMASMIVAGASAWPLGPQVIDIVGSRLWPYYVGEAINALVWGAMLHFALLFPHRSSWLQRHRWIALLPYCIPLLLYGARLVIMLPSADGRLEQLALLGPASLPAATVMPAIIGLAMVHGYRRTEDTAIRRRARWVLYTSCASFALYLLSGQIPAHVRGEPLVPWDWQGLFLIPPVLALAAAIMRYGLFDVEIILRRSAVYALLSVVAIAIYASAVVIIADVSGSSAPPTASLAAVAIAALGIQLLHSRTQRIVGHLIFGSRDDPEDVIGRLRTSYEQSTSTAGIPQSVIEELARALRLPYAELEFELRNGHLLRACVGAPRGTPLEIPLWHLGERMGHLRLEVGEGREPFGPADRRLLSALAGQLSLTAHNIILTEDERRLLQQKIIAVEEERLRLRRDFHDGIGRVVVETNLYAQEALTLVATDPERAYEAIRRIVATQQRVPEDLHRILYDIRPPELDALGLVGAVRDYCQRCISDTLDISVYVDDANERLPAAVERTAYAITQRAVNNVVTHSGASRCTVDLRKGPSTLAVIITDNGIGLAGAAGHGMATMREEVTAIGGSCNFTSPLEGGTVVHAVLPVD